MLLIETNGAGHREHHALSLDTFPSSTQVRLGSRTAHQLPSRAAPLLRFSRTILVLRQDSQPSALQLSLLDEPLDGSNILITTR